MLINFTVIQIGNTIIFNKNFMVTPLFLPLFYPIPNQYGNDVNPVCKAMAKKFAIALFFSGYWTDEQAPPSYLSRYRPNAPASPECQLGRCCRFH